MISEGRQFEKSEFLNISARLEMFRSRLKGTFCDAYGATTDVSTGVSTIL